MSQKTLGKFEQFRQDLTDLIDTLNLNDLQKHTVKLRWLDQVIWYSKKAKQCRNWYYFLRLTAIIGGLLVPALITFGNGTIPELLTVVFFISLIVAVSAAIEEFYNYGERWRNFRRTAETLKIEGWSFIQLSGAYDKTRYASHKDAYQTFAGHVEEIIPFEVKVYLSEIVVKQEKKVLTGKPSAPDGSGTKK
jgi:hypothetical protein